MHPESTVTPGSEKAHTSFHTSQAASGLQFGRENTEQQVKLHRKQRDRDRE